MPSQQIFLIDEVIAQLSDTSVSLEKPLWKLFVFAKQIKNKDLENFLHAELNGYKGEMETPEYRKIGANLILNLQDEYSKTNIEFPVSLLPDPWNNTFQNSHIRDSIASIEKLLSSSNSEDQFIFMDIPLEILVSFKQVIKKFIKSNNSFITTGGKLVSHGNKLPEVLANIRSKIIEFCFAVAEDFGHEIDLSNFNSQQQLNQDKIYHIMATTINTHGDGNIINTGKSSTINATINITKGSIEELKNGFRSLGIDDTDIIEITEIVQSEYPNDEKKRLGDRAIGWISKITEKALKGIGSIATDASSSILAEMVMRYYGI